MAAPRNVRFSSVYSKFYIVLIVDVLDLVNAIKVVMDRGLCDIVTPQWILDCVQHGELVALRKKYVSWYTLDSGPSANLTL